MDTLLVAWWIFFKMDNVPNPEPSRIESWLEEYSLLSRDDVLRILRSEYPDEELS